MRFAICRAARIADVRHRFRSLFCRAHGFGDPRNRMTNPDEIQTGIVQAGLDLEMAAWIGSVHGFRPCRADVAYLLFEKFLCLVWLRQIVNPSASTTPRGVGEGDHGRAGVR